MPHDFGILAQPCQDFYLGVSPEPLHVLAVPGSRGEKGGVAQSCQCENGKKLISSTLPLPFPHWPVEWVVGRRDREVKRGR